MAELYIQCPGQPDQSVTLADRTVTVGRGEDCTAFISELKASRRHLKVRCLPEGGALAEDQGSSNGTWVLPPGGEEWRILRRVLTDGDVLRIGDTRLTYIEGAATPTPSGGSDAPLVSGTLGLVAAAPPSTAGAPAVAAPAPGPRDAPAEAWTDSGRGAGGMDRKALGRALAIFAVAAVALVAVEFYLGREASQKTRRKAARSDAMRILGHLDVGAERFEAMRDDFARHHPTSPDLRTLDRYLEDLRRREEHAVQVHKQLELLQARMDVMPSADYRFRLLQLQRLLPEDEDFGLRIARSLHGLDRRRAEADLDATRDLERRVQAALDVRRPARAARTIASFHHANPSMGAEALERWRALRDRVDGILKKTFEDVWAKADAEQDSATRHGLLAEAWPALAGSVHGDRIADRLASAASMATVRPRPSAGPARPAPDVPPDAPPTPPEPTVDESLLARARDAEALLADRRWKAGRDALEGLLVETKGGLLHAEWTARLGEVDHILGLVQKLAEAAQAERKPRPKLSTGRVTVHKAGPDEVVLESRKQGKRAVAWADLTPGDVLALLRPARIALEDRYAIAVLAAHLGDRTGFVEAMLPVYEKGGDLAAADELVARHLHGLAEPPEGGYRAYKGEILDTRGYERRQEQERIAFLRSDADRLLGLIEKEAAFKKLARLRGMRAELDKRRRYALLAIFNTTHYPYPANKASQQYQAVQQEIDRRIDAVREIWDDPYIVRVKRAGQLEKHLDAWDTGLGELKRRHADVSDLETRIAAYMPYVTDEPITIRTFTLTPEEKEHLAYNAWVMQKYNPARREVARDAEWRQVQITNEYRMLMGFMAIVNPGPAPYEAIDKDSVVKILDAGEIAKTSPLRAVRIDNRLVTSARLHSEDMARRGYFAHPAPPNPATGEGATGPADRMRKKGYQGWSYSENIAQSANPQQAHTMWRHSSGHHRNILSGWTDLGSGVGGRNFTQNFAGGGGAKPQVYPDTAIRERKDARATGGRQPRR